MPDTPAIPDLDEARIYLLWLREKLASHELARLRAGTADISGDVWNFRTDSALIAGFYISQIEAGKDTERNYMLLGSSLRSCRRDFPGPDQPGWPEFLASHPELVEEA